jgi:hypothetical protein
LGAGGELRLVSSSKHLAVVVMTYLGALTTFHTTVSVIAILTGAAAMTGLLRGGHSGSWTRWFLLTAVVTSVTGFFFPYVGLTPALIVGVVALAILGVVLAWLRAKGEPA